MEKEAKKKAPVAPKKQRTSIKEYLLGIKTEMKKVIWPTRKELWAYTTVVVFTCAFFAIGFWLVDSGVLAVLRVMLGINM